MHRVGMTAPHPVEFVDLSGHRVPARLAAAMAWCMLDARARRGLGSHPPDVGTRTVPTLSQESVKVPGRHERGTETEVRLLGALGFSVDAWEEWTRRVAEAETTAALRQLTQDSAKVPE